MTTTTRTDGVGVGRREGVEQAADHRPAERVAVGLVGERERWPRRRRRRTRTAGSDSLARPWRRITLTAQDYRHTVGRPMQPTMLAPPLRSTLDTTSEAFAKNRADMLEQLAVIDAAARRGRGRRRPERAWSACAQRGKLPVRERIANVLDPDSPFLEISPLAGYDSDYTIGGGMVRRHRRHRRHRVRDPRQRPVGARRRAHALRGQEVDARARDRPRQPHALRELRRVGRRRPARARPATARRPPGRRPTTSPRPAASSTR